MKKCSKCKIEKAESDFYANYRNCKPCHKEIVKNYAIKNKDTITPKRKDYDLLRRYGISFGEYQKMYKEQDGKCAICKSSKIGRKGSKHFNVDHCHNTGKVRGLLCHNCNIILGKMRDKKQFLLNAIKYLEGV